jgi:hypothetical protein
MKPGNMSSHSIHLTEEDADISEAVMWLERAIQKSL